VVAQTLLLVERYGIAEVTMMLIRRVVPAFLVVALAGCVVAPASAPYPPVPPPMTEVEPAAPISADPVVWQPGHWIWSGSAYVWAPGVWILAAGHGALWQSGYWTMVNGAYVWVPAHWT
jgi:WXXGXW repeat (2 copies)